MENVCDNCDKNVSNLVCSKCKQKNYCSVACQSKDWEFHKKICNKKSLAIFIYKGNVSIQKPGFNLQEFIGDVDNQIGYHIVNMVESPEMSRCNPKATKCWEVKTGVKLPSITECPYSLMFTIDGICRAANIDTLNYYNNIERDYVTTRVLDKMAFSVYRSMDDEYIITHVTYVEY